jgi:hypothetical protein
MEEYTEKTDLPIFVEFCYKNNLVRQYLYEIPELSDAIKRLLQKKEMILEKGGLSNKLNPTMCIFSLKQMGWSDKRELNIKTDEEETKKKLKEMPPLPQSWAKSSR